MLVDAGDAGKARKLPPLARLGVAMRTRTRRSRAGLNSLAPLRGWCAAGQATSRNRRCSAKRPCRRWRGSSFVTAPVPALTRRAQWACAAARLDSSGPGVFAETGFLAHVVQPGSVACPDERG